MERLRKEIPLLHVNLVDYYHVILEMYPVFLKGG